ncbi:MAG: elongation factor P [Candidatus Krumholzibacteria bacterium]|jgi:elongation factor P|nr:elongation factor P [Candidatus Krumholzibacteria bacterium]MDP6669000.1 elongation factor P [Candidatus Krumholzibacteria bacterium]MDP6797395.1 elongation factor P [Candidatus Krumholzibacteria bacterium]MDP7021090.1 elongation factor P [Candidatus Krumholzibacteria bacterium]
MPRVLSSQLRVGNVVLIDGDLWRITYQFHVTPGKGPAHIQLKMKNLHTGNNKEVRSNTGDKLEKVDVITEKKEFLYQSGDEFVFMDVQDYEQISLNPDLVEEALPYLVPNIVCDVQTYEGRVVGLALPKTVDMDVQEAPPEAKNATATAQTKPATMETGLIVTVPAFVNTGDRIRVDTSTGKYLERA